MGSGSPFEDDESIDYANISDVETVRVNGHEVIEVDEQVYCLVCERAYPSVESLKERAHYCNL